MKDIIKKLRDGERVRLFDSSSKKFMQLQINKADNRICWERWVSLDKSNWVCYNKCLSLKEVVQLIDENKLKNKTT